MGGCRRTRERDDSQHIRAFPEKNLILTHYMLSVWWFHLLFTLGNYVIQPGVIELVLVMTKSITTLG